MRRLVFLMLLAAGPCPGCQQPRQPVWYVPADSCFSEQEVEQRTQEVLAELGYQVESVDPRLGLISTRWQNDSRMLSTRSRVELRFKPTPPYGVAISVPQQIHDGSEWVPDGEEPQRRRQLVASLTARLARPAEPKR